MILTTRGRYVGKTLGPELQEHGRTLPERFRRPAVALAARPINAGVRPTQQVPIVIAGEDGCHEADAGCHGAVASYRTAGVARAASPGPDPIGG
jgi:hypothetical protein